MLRMVPLPRFTGEDEFNRSRDAPCALVIARSISDEAIQCGALDWIASRHFVPLAITKRSRGAPLRPSYSTPLSEIVTTGHKPFAERRPLDAYAGGPF